MIGRAPALLLSVSPVMAEMRIPGPEGPLAAMVIPVRCAKHSVVLIPGSGDPTLPPDALLVPGIAAFLSRRSNGVP